jgi:hypothetical protein
MTLQASRFSPSKLSRAGSAIHACQGIALKNKNTRWGGHQTIKNQGKRRNMQGQTLPEGDFSRTKDPLDLPAVTLTVRQTDEIRMHLAILYATIEGAISYLGEDESEGASCLCTALAGEFRELKGRLLGAVGRI